MHPTFAEHWLVQGLSPDARSALYALGAVLEVEVDQVIIEADAPNRHMYLLLEGAFKVNLPNRPQRPAGFTLGHRGPGDLLGEYSFLDALKPTARVTASTRGRVLRIPHGALRDLLAEDPVMSSVIYRNMLRYLVERLRAQDEELDCVLF
jgi:CRP-like cAMP-binding protein